MGAWIEIWLTMMYIVALYVAPVWGRGLKLVPDTRYDEPSRRPRMGAWIEIRRWHRPSGWSSVAPVWGRGLKLDGSIHRPTGYQSPPYGGVD